MYHPVSHTCLVPQKLSIQDLQYVTFHYSSLSSCTDHAEDAVLLNSIICDHLSE